MPGPVTGPCSGLQASLWEPALTRPGRSVLRPAQPQDPVSVVSARPPHPPAGPRPGWGNRAQGGLALSMPVASACHSLIGTSYLQRCLRLCVCGFVCVRRDGLWPRVSPGSEQSCFVMRVMTLSVGLCGAGQDPPKRCPRDSARAGQLSAGEASTGGPRPASSQAPTPVSVAAVLSPPPSANLTLP